MRLRCAVNVGEVEQFRPKGYVMDKSLRVRDAARKVNGQLVQGDVLGKRMMPATEALNRQKWLVFCPCRAEASYGIIPRALLRADGYWPCRPLRNKFRLIVYNAICPIDGKDSVT